MSQEKGLTGIREVARGFVGRRGKPLFDNCKSSGRPRVRFDLGCTANRPEDYHYTTWRHCIGYDNLAKELEGLQIGDLLKVEGWVDTQVVFDAQFKPIMLNGVPMVREYLIIEMAQKVSYNKQEKLPLAVGQES